MTTPRTTEPPGGPRIGDTGFCFAEPGPCPPTPSPACQGPGGHGVCGYKSELTDPQDFHVWGLDRTGLGLGQGGEGLAGVWVWRGGHQGGARRGERASELCVCSRTECGLGPRARPRPSPTPACALGPGERARWDRRQRWAGVSKALSSKRIVTSAGAGRRTQSLKAALSS